MNLQEMPAAGTEVFRSTPAFVATGYIAVAIGILGYLIGLWNYEMSLSEKGFYATLLPFGLFGVIALQKSVRDRAEGVPVTSFFLVLSGVATGISILLLMIGLFNAAWDLTDKGFFGLAFLMSLFSVIVIQKNVRDIELTKTRSDQSPTQNPKRKSETTETN